MLGRFHDKKPKRNLFYKASLGAETMRETSRQEGCYPGFHGSVTGRREVGDPEEVVGGWRREAWATSVSQNFRGDVMWCGGFGPGCVSPDLLETVEVEGEGEVMVGKNLSHSPPPRAPRLDLLP